jgi:hypothetical protein
MQIVRGDDKTFSIERYDVNEKLITDKAEELIITCKENAYTNKIIFQKTLSSGDIEFKDGVYSFEIKGSDTEKLSYDTYYLDVVVYENNKKRTVHLDELEVTKHYNFNEGEMQNE